MPAVKSHGFRLAKPAPRLIRGLQAEFTARTEQAFERWSEYRQHKRVVAEALAARAFGTMEPDAKTKASLVALRRSYKERIPAVMDGVSDGPPIFHVKPGLNILGPPYDFALSAATGSNKPAIMNDVSSGRFAVVGSAISGRGTFGSAGMSLFIVPSHPSRTLAIRPYFEWQYIYSCESDGPPTSHSHGVISASASGHRGSSTLPFPDRSQPLWSASSDAWDDDHGNDSGVFVGLDSQLLVSGADFYTVSFVCQAAADSADGNFGWFSQAFFQLHCRVPYLFVEEF